MGRTADGDTFGNRLFDGEKLQELLSKDVAQHTRYDDDNHRNRNMTAQLLRNADTDGGSDALRQEGYVGRMVEMEDEGEIYESIEDIWPDYPSKEDFFFNEEEY